MFRAATSRAVLSAVAFRSSSTLTTSGTAPRFVAANMRRSTTSRISRFSTKSDGSKGPKADPVDHTGASNSVSTEVLTPGEKVVAGSYLVRNLALLTLAGACAWFIALELMPSKLSPNSIMDATFEVVRKDDTCLRMYGEDMKCYGRDHGGRAEGRRNFIDHTSYVADKEDGSKRSRIKYTIEGHDGRAKGWVFAEVSADMPSGEFVYVMVQNLQGGAVHTLVDNRSAIKAGIYGKSTGGFAALLGRGK